MQQRIGSSPRVDLARLHVCELRLALAERSAVSTVLLEKTCVLETQRRQALRDRDRRRSVCFRNHSLRGPRAD